MNHKHNQSRGFTIVELMLAMGFVAILLVSIALVTIQVSNIYNKGITLREVDQSGRSIASDFQRTIASSSPLKDVTPFVFTSSGTPTNYIVSSATGARWGRLCTGSYTYAWNTIDPASGLPTSTNNKYSDNQQLVSLVRVSDPDGKLCSSSTELINRAKATELLSSANRALGVYSFAIKQAAQDVGSGQALYVIDMQIGTLDGAQLVTGNASCKPPSDAPGFSDYCSVNQFTIVVRAGNQGGS